MLSFFFASFHSIECRFDDKSNITSDDSGTFFFLLWIHLRSSSSSQNAFHKRLFLRQEKEFSFSCRSVNLLSRGAFFYNGIFSKLFLAEHFFFFVVFEFHSLVFPHNKQSSLRFKCRNVACFSIIRKPSFRHNIVRSLSAN